MWDEIAEFFADLEARADRARTPPVPELTLRDRRRGDRCRSLPRRSWRSSCGSTARRPIRRSRRSRCAARFRSRRPGGAIAPEEQRAAVRSVWRAGSVEPRRCDRCCGPTRRSSCPRFEGATVVDLNVPCTFDFNVAATKYFDGLERRRAPAEFLFSGTVFYQDAAGPLQVMQISWDKEARFRLPVKAWTEMMEHYYPNSAWLRLRRDVFEKLAELQASPRDRDLGPGDRAISLADVHATVCAMSVARVEAVADAVLYEGYALYPYRPSSVKNRRRFNFGVLAPQGRRRTRGSGLQLADAHRVPGAGRCRARSCR